MEFRIIKFIHLISLPHLFLRMIDPNLTTFIMQYDQNYCSLLIGRYYYFELIAYFLNFAHYSPVHSIEEYLIEEFAKVIMITVLIFILTQDLNRNFFLSGFILANFFIIQIIPILHSYENLLLFAIFLRDLH